MIFLFLLLLFLLKEFDSLRWLQYISALAIRKRFDRYFESKIGSFHTAYSYKNNILILILIKSYDILNSASENVNN